MPGLLSKVFTDDQETNGGTHTTTQSSDVTVDQGLELSREVGIELGMDGSYQNLDGSTATWSHDVDITVALDVDAALDGFNSTESSEMGEG